MQTDIPTQMHTHKNPLITEEASVHAANEERTLHLADTLSPAMTHLPLLRLHYCSILYSLILIPSTEKVSLSYRCNQTYLYKSLSTLISAPN